MVYTVLLLAVFREVFAQMPNIPNLYDPSGPRLPPEANYYKSPPRPGTLKGPPLIDARGIKVRMPPAFRDVESPDFEEAKGRPADLYDLESKITRAGKWPEFLEKIQKTGEMVQKDGGGVMKNWEENAFEWADWAKRLEQSTTTTETPTTERNILRMAQSALNPSPGMSAYWEGLNADHIVPGQEKSIRQETISLKDVPNEFQMMQQQLRSIAPQAFPERVPQPLKNMNYGLSQNFQNPVLLPTTTADPLASYNLPKLDDFGAPIRWVKHNSVQIKDGLAKVTDPDTGINRNSNINGTIYVPILDSNLEKLGFTTSSPKPIVLTTDKAVLRTITSSVGTKKMDDRDWLVFEISRNISRFSDYSTSCQDIECKSRCQATDCKTKCSGDTCSAGCVGPSCDSYCQGSGCLSMCIGEQCRARCAGMTCDARCIGKDCDASCERLSCSKTINGEYTRGGGTWDENYPQYGSQNQGGQAEEGYRSGTKNNYGEANYRDQKEDYDDREGQGDYGGQGRDYGGQGRNYGGQERNYGGQGRNYGSQGRNYGGQGRDYGGTNRGYEGQNRGYRSHKRDYGDEAGADYGGPNVGDYGGPNDKIVRGRHNDYGRDYTKFNMD